MKVLLTFPTAPSHPFLHKAVVFVSWRLISDRRHRVTPIIPTHAPFEENLHRCVNDFVAGDYDFWLSIDADNPPTRNPLDLVDEGLDVVGFPTPVWHFGGEGKPGERPLYWNAYDYVPGEDAYKEHLPREGLQRVDAIGTGCFLIARRVFGPPEMRRGPFRRTYREDGCVDKGNDLAFCERARAHGFAIWAHYDYPCDHYNGAAIGLNEVVAGFKNLYEGCK